MTDAAEASLVQKTGRGLSWTAGAQIAKQVITTARFVILARLLAPAEFGAVAIIMVFVGLAGLISDGGLGVAVVQRTGIEDRHLHTAFWIQLALSAVAGVGLAALGGPIASVYHDPHLNGYALALGANFFISSWTTVHKALLTRQFRFGAMAVNEVVAAAFGTAVSAVWGFRTHSGWAIVVGAIASSAIGTAGLAITARWLPRFRFERAAARELLSFSLGVTGFQFVNFFVRNADNLLVGRFLGATALGYYTRGYQVLLYPLRQISAVVGRVMFPALASIQRDRERSKAAYLRSTTAIALVAFPTMAGLVLVADDFVLVTLGTRWLPAVTTIRLFAVVGLFESLSTTVGWIYLAQGKAKLQLLMGLAAGVPIVIGISLGVAGGTATTVALGYAGATALWWYPAIAIPGRLIDLKVHDLVRSVSGVAGCVAAMAVVVATIRIATSSLDPSLRLALETLAGAISYGSLVHIFQLRPYRDLLTAFRLKPASETR